MSGSIIAPSATISRARMRLEQAEAIIAGLSATPGRISALLHCAGARQPPPADAAQDSNPLIRRLFL